MLEESGLAWGMRAWGDKEDKVQQRHQSRRLFAVCGKLQEISSGYILRLEVGERKLDSEAGTGCGRGSHA